MLLESLSQNKVHVDRPYVPTSIGISSDEAELKNPQAHPVKVSRCVKIVDKKLTGFWGHTGCAQEFSSYRWLS